MILNDNQKELLNKYSIPFKDEYTDVDDFNDFLSKISDAMLAYVDKNDEPLEDFLILEKLYDEIFYDYEDEEISKLLI